MSARLTVKRGHLAIEYDAIENSDRDEEVIFVRQHKPPLDVGPVHDSLSLAVNVPVIEPLFPEEIEEGIDTEDEREAAESIAAYERRRMLKFRRGKTGRQVMVQDEVRKAPAVEFGEFTTPTDGLAPNNQDKVIKALTERYWVGGHPWFNRMTKNPNGVMCAMDLDWSTLCGIHFHTKNPFLKPELKAVLENYTGRGERGHGYIMWSISITGHGATPVEPGVRDPREVLAQLPAFVKWAVRMNGGGRGDPELDDIILKSTFVLHLDPISAFRHTVTGEVYDPLPKLLPDLIQTIYACGIRVLHLSFMHIVPAWRHIPKVLAHRCLESLFDTSIDASPEFQANWLREHLEPALQAVEMPGDLIKIQTCTGNARVSKLWPRLKRNGACLEMARCARIAHIKGVVPPPKKKPVRGYQHSGQCNCNVKARSILNEVCDHDCSYCFAQHRDSSF